ncbi:GGDEF domain-containing protein [Lactococcus taiwanensis]|uniref:GGDEF domain-containing protein n=1 Tax=Lactococcus taiwanensis TaxID=1151742 RepID=UPI003D14E9FB
MLPILIEISKKINSHPINYKGKVISVSISAGLAEMSTKNLVARDLYEEADNYLYYSKKNGRNKVTFNGKLY